MGHQLVIVKGRSSEDAVKLPPDGTVTTVGRQEGCQLRVVVDGTPGTEPATA